MKTIFALFLAAFGMAAAYSQEAGRAANTGDNFSLEGALAMFKKASSLKQFERFINDQKNNVTNLDLNGDGNIDYINVDDIRDGNSHILVLSTFLSETEKQDIATIAIDKTGDSEALLQIEGDKDLYAENTIMEPSGEKETIKDSKGGPNIPVIEIQSLVVNVWFWPCVQFMYAPKYVLWISPYRWSYHPNWWKPWRPFTYTVFYVRCAPHRLWYHPAKTRRVMAVQNVYAGKRHSSTLVVHNSKGVTIVRNNARGVKVKSTSIKRVPIKNPNIKRSVIRGAQIKGRVRR